MGRGARAKRSARVPNAGGGEGVSVFCRRRKGQRRGTVTAGLCSWWQAGGCKCEARGGCFRGGSHNRRRGGGAAKKSENELGQWPRRARALAESEKKKKQKKKKQRTTTAPGPSHLVLAPPAHRCATPVTQPFPKPYCPDPRWRAQAGRPVARAD